MQFFYLAIVSFEFHVACNYALIFENGQQDESYLIVLAPVLIEVSWYKLFQLMQG